MSLFHKRLLILFSVALNIGFVIMVIAVMVLHAHPSDKQSDKGILDIVQQLNLPRSQENSVVETIRGFKAVVDQNKQALKKARVEVVRCLAQNGSVDYNQLHRLTQAIGKIEKGTNEAFETHFMDLRNKLGDKKGAHFFTLLLTLHEPEEAKANP